MTRTSRSGSIEAAADQLREFWRIGSDSLHEVEAFRPGPNGQKRHHARRYGVSPERLRQARQFARKCDQRELERLIKQATAKKVAPSWLVVRQIYTLKDRRARNSLWRLAVKHHLSHKQILTYIRGQHLERDAEGKPRAGRKPTVSGDEDIAYARLLQETRSWITIADAVLELLNKRSARHRSVTGARKVLLPLLKRSDLDGNTRGRVP